MTALLPLLARLDRDDPEAARVIRDQAQRITDVKWRDAVRTMTITPPLGYVVLATAEWVDLNTRAEAAEARVVELQAQIADNATQAAIVEEHLTAVHLAAFNQGLVAGRADVKARVVTWEVAISAVMPADFKDWHENNHDEWPDVAAGVIQGLREREELAWDQVATAQAALEAENAGLREVVEATADRKDTDRFAAGWYAIGWTAGKEQAAVRVAELTAQIADNATQAAIVEEHLTAVHLAAFNQGLVAGRGQLATARAETWAAAAAICKVWHTKALDRAEKGGPEQDRHEECAITAGSLEAVFRSKARDARG